MAKKKDNKPARNKLTKEQQMFCHYYVLEGKSAKESYMLAYPESSETSASPNASRLMNKPHVKAYIDELIERQKNCLDISDRLILQGIAQLAFGEDVADSIKLKALTQLAKINGMFTQEINVSHQIIQVGIVDDDVPRLEDNNNGQIIGTNMVIIEDEEEDSEEE